MGVLSLLGLSFVVPCLSTLPPLDVSIRSTTIEPHDARRLGRNDVAANGVALFIRQRVFASLGFAVFCDFLYFSRFLQKYAENLME